MKGSSKRQILANAAAMREAAAEDLHGAAILMLSADLCEAEAAGDKTEVCRLSAERTELFAEQMAARADRQS